MSQPTYIKSLSSGKHYLGDNPCIPPLAMAELMVRLENRRKNPATLKPSNPLSKKLSNLVTDIINTYADK